MEGKLKKFNNTGIVKYTLGKDDLLPGKGYDKIIRIARVLRMSLLVISEA